MFKKSHLLLITLFFVILLSSCVHKIARGIWEPIAPLPTARSYSSADYLDGMIYVCGGGVYDLYRPYVDVYDTETGEWIDSYELPEGRSAHGTVVINDEIWLIGGLGSPLNHNDAIALDPKTKTWSQKALLPWHIDYPEAAFVNGDVYVMGGKVSDDRGRPTAATLKLDWESKEFKQIAEMNERRMKHSVASHDGKIFVFGGINIRGGAASDTAEVFDPQTGQWQYISPMPKPRQYQSSISVKDYIVLIGGTNKDCIDAPLNTVDIYLPQEDKWIEAVPMNEHRMNFSVAYDGSAIYVFGGSVENDVETTSDLSEVYRF